MIFPPPKRRTALVSVHDVMPETLPRVREIVRYLEAWNVFPFTLLVVPGKAWTARQMDRLRSWQGEGLELAGHGWRHRAKAARTLGHRLHAMAISRDEAEHLSLSSKKATEILQRCHGWFVRNGLRPPTLYVPPAWAMGSVPEDLLRVLPFSFYETLGGVYNARTGEHLRMPVTGYMADTPLRAMLLKAINALGLGLGWAVTRIAVHPDDLHLPLSRALSRHLKRFHRFSTVTCLSSRSAHLPVSRLDGRGASACMPPQTRPSP